jgi:uncharacterized protein (DUF2126 family)/transglutaminase-like putative cysteine protease
MSIRIALNHKTHYRFDRPVRLSPHEIRLKPAPHCRTPILAYSLAIAPAQHYLNWQQDPYGNFLARATFPEKTNELEIVVDLIAELTVVNPFDFFVESYAASYPFRYPEALAKELAPFLETEAAGPLLRDWLVGASADLNREEISTVEALVTLNQRVQREIEYVARIEPGLQSCEHTLDSKRGSCRDSAWLLVQILRNLNLAARFASGYLIQLRPDMKVLDGRQEPDQDSADLHAWAEVYIPGAGWIGLDPTSGLMAAEGHIPLACNAHPQSAAPVTGSTEVCESRFEFATTVTRLKQDPAVTKPYSDEQWREIDALGREVDTDLDRLEVCLTMGGEPTFVSIDNGDAPEWRTAALGTAKRALAGKLLRRLKQRFARGALLHFGEGKWYPGEALARWALGCYWRPGGAFLWHNDALIADEETQYGHTPAQAKHFIERLGERLKIDSRFVLPAHEDPWHYLIEEQKLPVDVDPLQRDLKNAKERSALARLLDRGLGEIAGYVLPLAPCDGVWQSTRWPLKRAHLYLIPGDSPIGSRLPLSSLPSAKPEDQDEIVRTALCTEIRERRLHVFIPPIEHFDDYLVLVSAIEQTAEELKTPLVIEGFPPPDDPRLKVFKITPDPGVIEVNIHPSASWRELTQNTEILYEEARLTRLTAEKFMLDGRQVGTGGGHHVTVGGARPHQSPILRRPDLLRSLVTYWQNHPALSYLFSGLFVGPTSQAPRVDEARHESLYELEISFQQLAQKVGEQTPALVDLLFRNLLVDLTGNTHRAEFCIDKLYSPVGPTGRLGLLEFRAFEMPPHPHMSLALMVLLRALIAGFWKKPYGKSLIRWNTALHDKFMLPHFIAQDANDVARELQASGYAFKSEWLAPFLEFHFPRYGCVAYEGIELELRQAIEPWNVLGEEVASSGTARYVDSSVERLQVKVNNLVDARYRVACNGRAVPLSPTGKRGEFVAGVRFQARSSALHPTVPVHAPLVFDVVDTWSERSIGGCTYHVADPRARDYETFPVNSREAEARRAARFLPHGHTPGPMAVGEEPRNRDFPLTLDLRRDPD